MRRCGNCIFGRPDGTELVFCGGAPPTVFAVETLPDNRRTIRSQAPLMSVLAAGCGRHRYRWGLFGIWWWLTGGR